MPERATKPCCGQVRVVVQRGECERAARGGCDRRSGNGASAHPSRVAPRFTLCPSQDKSNCPSYAWRGSRHRRRARRALRGCLSELQRAACRRRTSSPYSSVVVWSVCRCVSWHRCVHAISVSIPSLCPCHPFVHAIFVSMASSLCPCHLCVHAIPSFMPHAIFQRAPERRVAAGGDGGRRWL